MMIRLAVLASLFLSFSAAAEPARPDASPAAVAALVTKDLLARDELMMYRVDDVEAVHYAEAAAAYGAARIAILHEDDATLARIEARYRRLAAENVPNTANHVDANVIGLWPLEIYMRTGDRELLADGLSLADGQWAHLQEDGLTSQSRFWIDDVWMVGALQVAAYRATGKTIYLDRAARMAVVYLDKLQQPNGLFHHGPEAPFFWGRGNGWVAAGLAEILSDLPAEHPSYLRIREGYRKMMAALLEHQSETGMWRQLIDHEDAWEESSSTAMFGFAMAAGVKRGILTDPRYRQAYVRAWSALMREIGPDGRIAHVCVGTGQSKEVQYYLERPTVTGDLHGQAPVLWFAATMIENGEGRDQ